MAVPRWLFADSRFFCAIQHTKKIFSRKCIPIGSTLSAFSRLCQPMRELQLHISCTSPILHSETRTLRERWPNAAAPSNAILLCLRLFKGPIISRAFLLSTALLKYEEILKLKKSAVDKKPMEKPLVTLPKTRQMDTTWPIDIGFARTCVNIWGCVFKIGKNET